MGSDSLSRKEKAKLLFHNSTDAIFQQKCQEAWKLGLKRRDEDEVLTAEKEARRKNEEKARISRIKEEAKLAREERKERRSSIWEAVKDGCSVAKFEKLIETEVKKESQRGSTFRVLDAHPDHGSTLIQLACWHGHEEIVAYLINKGANIKQVDSFCNKFTLLHDCARAGHASMIPKLIAAGLKPDVCDSYGDTPMHWAVRRKHIDCVKAILDTDLPNSFGMTAVWKSLCTKNNRGRCPIDISTNKLISKLLKDCEREINRRKHQEEHNYPKESDQIKRKGNLELLHKLSHLEGKQNIVKSLLEQSVVEGDDIELVGKGSASVCVKEQRAKHYRIKKATAKAVNSISKHSFKEPESVEKHYGKRWKAKIKNRNKK